MALKSDAKTELTHIIFRVTLSTAIPYKAFPTYPPVVPFKFSIKKNAFLKGQLKKLVVPVDARSYFLCLFSTKQSIQLN